MEAKVFRWLGYRVYGVGSRAQGWRKLRESYEKEHTNLP